MNSIDPAELSAYLDGELDPVRAREVEAALARSSELRAEFDTLLNADNAWRAAARTASFRPGIQLQRDHVPVRSALRVTGAVILLLAARLVPKLAGTFEVELILNGVALTIVLFWILRMAGRDIRAQSA